MLRTRFALLFRKHRSPDARRSVLARGVFSAVLWRARGGLGGFVWARIRARIGDSGYREVLSIQTRSEWGRSNGHPPTVVSAPAAPSDLPVIRLTLLGEAAVESSRGESLPLSPKRLAVLAYLALADPPGYRGSGTVVQLFWPEHAPSAAPDPMRQALSVIRRLSDEGPLIEAHPEPRLKKVRIRPGRLTTDVHEFAAAVEGGDLERAADLYGGRLLASVQLEGCPDFERWVEEESARLTDRYVGVLERLARRDAAAQLHEKAVQWWDRAQQERPYNGTLVIGMMASLEAAGDRVRAIEHGESYIQRLRSHLEAEPEPDVLRMLDELRREPLPLARPSVRVRNRGASGAPVVSPPRPHLQTAILGFPVFLTLAHLLAIGAATAYDGLFPALWDDTSVDPGRYAVIVPSQPDGLDEQILLSQRLQDAMARWSEVTIVDQFQVRDGLGRNERPVDVARRLGAGHYVRSAVSAIDGSYRVEATLYNSISNRAIATRTQRIPASLIGADSLIMRLVAGLVLADLAPAQVPITPATRSPTALRAFARGQTWLRQWDLRHADEAFLAAVNADPEYAQAHLWLALVRAWAGVDPARVRVPAEQALLRTNRLSTRDSMMAHAIVAQARGETGRACAQWRALTVRVPKDFAVWYGKAHCLATDSIVVRDTASPSGWAFRSSHHEAVEAYEQAFLILPSMLAAFRSGSYEPLRRILRTSGNVRRLGRASPPNRTVFRAYQSWRDDTLAFVPHPMGSDTSKFRVDPLRLNRSVVQQRRVFRDIASAWVGTARTNPAAWEALGIALASLGHRSAVDSLERARMLTTDSDLEIRINGELIWLRVLFAIRDRDLPALELAEASLDSLLLRISGMEGPPEPLMLGGLATLAGRARLAASLSSSEAAAHQLGAPAALQPGVLDLMVHAAMGGPREVLDSLEHHVLISISERMVAQDRPSALLGWLGFPATLAAPEYRFKTLDSISPLDDPILQAQAALENGDRDGVLRILHAYRERRADALPFNVSVDALYSEAVLLFAIGEYGAAAEWLDPHLRALPQVALDVVGNPARAGPLVRGMALRARIAHALSHTEDTVWWASAVLTLWRSSDAFLQPFVREMTSLASQ